MRPKAARSKAPSPSPKGYRKMVEQALDDYEVLTGIRLELKRFDPSQDEVQAAYKSFRRKPLARLNLGPTQGEWMAMRAGLKTPGAGSGLGG